MSKLEILEGQLKELEEDKKKIEKRIRDTKIELRRLKVGKNFKEMVFKKNKKGMGFKW
jgi:septal ring factor EnvC (AmiA/AmiB activator)